MSIFLLQQMSVNKSTQNNQSYWNHIRDQDTTYFAHMRKSLSIGLFSLRGFGWSVVHAVFPDVRPQWTRDMVKDIALARGLDLKELQAEIASEEAEDEKSK